MSATSGVRLLEAPSEPRVCATRKDLLLVVGYDGSPPSQRGLEKAAELLGCREGWLEVVFVGHTPSTVTYAPEAIAELRQGLDEESKMLEKQAAAVLIHQRRHWRFRRRDGAVAEQLLSVAKELRDRYRTTKDIAIVVGGSAQRYHHIVGSVSASLARSCKFPIIVVP